MTGDYSLSQPANTMYLKNNRMACEQIYQNTKTDDNPIMVSRTVFSMIKTSLQSGSSEYVRCCVLNQIKSR